MSNSCNEEFIKFIKSFDEGSHENHKFHDTITEISRKHSGKREPLIENDFEMYSLDDIKDGSKLLKDNPPKTTDALYFKLDDGKLILYLIEFKFHNLDDPDAKDLLNAFVNEIYSSDNKKKYDKCLSKNDKKDLNKIRNYYGDDVSNTLVLKPIETIRVVLPRLYEEYYNKNPNVEKIDIREYLDLIEKRYFVFVSTYTETGKFNRHKEELESQSTGLEKYFDRLKSGNIIDHYEIWPRCDFEDFLKIEQLVKVE